MAQSVQFKGTNAVLSAPPGVENVDPLPVFRNGVCLVSCWELTDAELVEILSSRKVYLAVYGQSQPPVCLGSETSMRSLVADYGVWKK